MERGSGNAFAELELHNAGVRLLKADFVSRGDGIIR